MASRLEKVKSLEDLIILWKADMLYNYAGEKWGGRYYHRYSDGTYLGDYWVARGDLWEEQGRRAYMLVEYDEEEVLPSKAQA